MEGVFLSTVLPFIVCNLFDLKEFLNIARNEFSYFFHAIWRLSLVFLNFMSIYTASVLKTVKLPDCAFNCLFHSSYFPTVQNRVQRRV